MSEKELVEEEEFEEQEKEEVENIDLDKDKHILATSVNIPKDLLKELGYIAVKEGVSRGEIIRRAVKDYIETHKSNPNSEDEVYKEKVKKAIKLYDELKEHDFDVTLDLEDISSEKIDETIAQLEKALKKR